MILYRCLMQVDPTIHAVATKGCWRTAFWHALPITIFLLALYTYWFAVADRYRVFLYFHDMGPLVPDTAPFSPVTSSRYWMAGLVAAGAVMVLYGGVNWLVGRWWAGYRPPPWWQVWGWCVAPLVVGVPWLTMSVNTPTLPLLNALQTMAVLLVGLAFALLPGTVAATKPIDLLWCTADGLGLMLLLNGGAALTVAGQWLARGRTIYIWLALLVSGTGLGWLLLMTMTYRWRRRSAPSLTTLLCAGVCVAYLLMPLVHHVGFTDGHYYLTDAANFFAREWWGQLSVWLSVGLVAWAVTKLRRQLDHRSSAPKR
ncbi:MAG: hypothetical protein R3E79_09495 [Caldilineaceae bacterium]